MDTPILRIYACYQCTMVCGLIEGEKIQKLDLPKLGETTVIQSLLMWVFLSSEYPNFGLNCHRENEQRQVFTYPDRWRERMLQLLAIFPSLGHQNASTFLPWYGSISLPRWAYLHCRIRRTFAVWLQGQALCRPSK